jgi:hypothetical protein
MALLELEVKQNSGTFLADGQHGAAVDVQAWGSPRTLQFTGMQLGTFSTANLQIEASNDGVTFTAVESAVTTNGFVTLTAVHAWVRILTNHITSGAPGCWLVGHVHSL